MVLLLLEESLSLILNCYFYVLYGFLPAFLSVVLTTCFLTVVLHLRLKNIAHSCDALLETSAFSVIHITWFINKPHKESVPPFHRISSGNKSSFKKLQKVAEKKHTCLTQELSPSSHNHPGHSSFRIGSEGFQPAQGLWAVTVDSSSTLLAPELVREGSISWQISDRQTCCDADRQEAGQCPCVYHLLERGTQDSSAYPTVQPRHDPIEPL